MQCRRNRQTNVLLQRFRPVSPQILKNELPRVNSVEPLTAKIVDVWLRQGLLQSAGTKFRQVFR